MPNKHFCQGPTCHTRTTNDRFLKSRGVLRGKFAYEMDYQNHPESYYDNRRNKYFCSQSCESKWLSVNMENIEQGRLIEFVRHRRESQGYAKVKNEDRWGGQYSIQRVDNGQVID